MTVGRAARYYLRDGTPCGYEEYLAKQYGEEKRYKAVALTSIWDTTGKVIEVSTIWLGENHRLEGPGPPLIFETKVFGLDGDDEHTERYSTEAEALRGHGRLVVEYCAKTGAGVHR